MIFEKNNDLNSGDSVGVYWNDINVYHDGGIYTPTPSYTEGLFVKIVKNYFVVENPETILIAKKGVKNHPKESKKKIKFLCIPKKLIKDIVIYGKEK